MDFPLFETICIEQGKIKNIAFHQQRYQSSLLHFYGKSAVKIYDLLALIEEKREFHTALFNALCRCRLSYNAQDVNIELFPYQRKSYQRFHPVVCDDIDYGLKYQNRDRLNKLLAQRGDADEIIVIKQGKVTDCSIGNLIFRQNKQWFTPDSPLLEGTQRAYLLQQKKIKAIPIFAEDIAKFDEIRIINAMNGLDEY
ncbi:aminotransferase class IV family protein [Pasteurellaceae bacterium 22721_9_1]